MSELVQVDAFDHNAFKITPTLNQLTGVEKAHWQLHLNAAQNDGMVVTGYLASTSQLPNIKHPAYVHDWLEFPERRTEIEAWNG